MEELPTTKHLTPEETACEKLYEETTKFIDNRLVVNLSFKKSVELGDSLEQAKRRFSYLERRRKRYQAFLQEFLDMNHMEEVPQHQMQRPANQCYYLPHHCVFKEDSTTTKLRVVFDGSAKTSNGISINEALMVGPVVQDDLFTIITRFRFYKIALTGDVEKMYRQVGLREEDKEFNVIRVGGRLGQSPYCENKKFPVLISKNSSLVPLIIRHFHEASLHGGGQLTLNLIRQEFWIVNAKPLVNQFIKECITCFRFNTTPPVQLMADLPTERVTPSRPFTHCGIHFAGHFLVKNGETVNKVYIAIFVCMSTKAVHMELVSSLSKDDCIMALNRFIARRGMPAKILSDNGTNFLGARNDLIKLNVLLDKTDRDNSLITFVNQRNCEWITIPPRAPHFGGIWEAAVKSMKRHLRRVVGKQIFSYEEFLTIINQVEAALNSRPISPLSNDPNDPVALTPGYFLIGDTLMSRPSGAPSKSNPVQRFRLVKKIQEDFWKSWKRDYLTELQIRKKMVREWPRNPRW